MGKKVFVSYRHHQRDWALGTLVPTLEAGGVSEILVDADSFRAGDGVIGQMDATQDRADTTLLVLSPDYLESAYCMHELERAVATHAVIPVIRQECVVPELLDGPDPLLRVDLRRPEDPSQWGLLLESCEAVIWRQASDQIVTFLDRGQSVNLVCRQASLWKPLLQRVRRKLTKPIGEVDFERGIALTRPGLVSQILKACGEAAPVPDEPHDLVELDRRLSRTSRASLLAFLHFHQVEHKSYYSLDLFSTLRHLIMGSRRLVVLVHSHHEFANSLPADHPLSDISITTVQIGASAH